MLKELLDREAIATIYNYKISNLSILMRKCIPDIEIVGR